ncbi:mechanosensitive ion channel family protein [Bacillus spongiae]|uniref:Mechanosensitive ion channel family protein n=1 Tax=Bacillus spongiae TaxID=2683610 RepID=A0ABU8HCR8_9BACI
MNYQDYFTMDILQDILISISILAIFLLFRKIFTSYVYRFLIRVSKKSPTTLFTHIFTAFENPIGWLFIVFGVFIAVDFFPFLDQNNPLFMKIFRSLVIFHISWGLYNLTSSSSILFQNAREKYHLEVDDILIPYLSKGVRFIVIAISFSIIAQEFDYDVNGFVAGLGLGGLAFALAAKDAIGNFFGGIVIITERPFSIGDWIKTPSVEGTIEDITFRSTKVRTFEQALVTVPNASLANEAITNWSKMGKRRITFNLGLTYDTPKEKIELVVQRIKLLLENHDDIHQDTIFVTFNEFNTNSLDIFLYFFTNTTDWGEYLKVRENINLEILNILEEAKAEVAFPTRTLYLQPNEDTIAHLSKSMAQKSFETERDA